MSKTASKTAQSAANPVETLRWVMAEVGHNVIDLGFQFSPATVTCNHKGCTAQAPRDIALDLGWTTSVCHARGRDCNGVERHDWHCPLHSGHSVQSEEVKGATTTGIVWQYKVLGQKVTDDGHNALGVNGWTSEPVEGRPNVMRFVSERRDNAKDRSEGFNKLEARRQEGKLVLGGNQLGVTFTLEDKLDKEMWDSLEACFPAILEAMQEAFKGQQDVRKRILGSPSAKLDFSVENGVLTGHCLWQVDEQVEECCRMAETILHLWATWYDRKGAVEKVASRLTKAIQGKGFPVSSPNWHNVNQKRGWRSK